MEYKIGQILVSQKDEILTEAFSGNEVVVPAGNKVIIGADSLAHHIRNGMIQPLRKDAEVKGYDAAGLAEYLFLVLRNHIPLDEMLEDYDETEEHFKEEIECALDEIGL